MHLQYFHLMESCRTWHATLCFVLLIKSFRWVNSLSLNMEYLRARFLALCFSLFIFCLLAKFICSREINFNFYVDDTQLYDHTQITITKPTNMCVCFGTVVYNFAYLRNISRQGNTPIANYAQYVRREVITSTVSTAMYIFSLFCY